MKKTLSLLFIGILLSVFGHSQYVTIPDPAFKAFLKEQFPTCFNGADMMDTSCSAIMISGTFYLRSYNNYDGLQYFKSLKQLDCDAANFNFIPYLPASLEDLTLMGNVSSPVLPSLPATLKYLACDNLNITSISSLPDSLQFLKIMGSEALVGLPALPSKLRHLWCNMVIGLVSLPPLPSTLTNLSCNNSSLQQLPALPASLETLSCDNCKLTNLPTLPASLNSLFCGGNLLTALPKLSQSLQYLSCNKNSLTELPELPSGLLHLSCINNSLSNLPVLPASLTELYCINNKLPSLPTLPGSLTKLFCSNNQIAVLPILPTGLTELVCDNNKLVNLPFLPESLNRLEVASNLLIKLHKLPLSLKTFHCANNLIDSLPALPDSLEVLRCDNNNFKSLPALPNLLRQLYCNNNKIYCLPFLPASLYQIEIEGTKVSCLPNKSSAIVFAGPDVTFFPICNATNNPNGCHAFPVIDGIVFFDANQNGTRDNGELTPRHSQLKLSGNTYTLTNDTGYYEMDARLGKDTLTAIPPVFFKAEPASLPLDLVSYDTLVSQDIALLPLLVKDSLHISTASYRQTARPGFSHPYLVSFENRGTTNLSPATIQFRYDDNLLTYDSSNLPGVVQSGNLLTLTLSSFPYGSLTSFTAYFTVKVTAPLGNYVYAVATASSNEVYVFADTTWNVISGSFDPNDKSATPSLSPQQLISGKYINYTVRFQNTGTDTAFTVVITDTLSDKLQKNTLEVLGSSHLCKTTVNDGIVYFEFKNILLPDSNVNEPASHGYVNFRVKPQPGLALNTTIENTASIYFDFNEPVVTNTAITIIKNPSLPVSLLSFTGSLHGSQVRLNWQTASEMNFRGFEVERSADGLKFGSIGSKWSAGNANGAAYSLIDAQPQIGRNYYRLKMLDKDGTARYSGIVLVVYNKNRLSVLIGPNPGKGVFTVQVLNAGSGTSSIRVTDLSGKLVYMKQLPSGNGAPISIDMHAMQKGMYLISIENNGEKLVQKLELQ